jgi:hypothetical protein
MPKRLICVLLLCIGTFAHANAALLRPKPNDGYEIKEGKIYFRRGNAGLIVQAATPELIEKYYMERGAPAGNPLLNISRGMQNPVFFLVTLINRTNGSLTFTPRYVIAKIKTDAYFPLDYLTMMDVLEDQPPAMKSLLEKSIYHSPELLQPGKIVTKFLIFPELPKEFDDIRLSFDYLYFESTEIKSDFLFTTRASD